MKYGFCFTLDTEPDNLWQVGGPIEFQHVERLRGFHDALVESGARPTYLTTSEFAEHATAQRVMQSIMNQGNAEIGVHFHTWTRPWPFEVPDLGNPLQPALAYRLGSEIEEKMLQYTCKTIKKFWEIEPRSFRGGRWSLSGQSLRALRNCGIKIDSTVTPGLSWCDKSHFLVDGPDFSRSIRFPHFMAGDSLEPSSEGDIFEIPVGTACFPRRHSSKSAPPVRSFATKVLQKLGFSYGIIWLRPTVYSRTQMLSCLRELKRLDVPVWVAMIHSSEIIPCRYFKTESAVKAFWRRCFDLVHDALEMGAAAMTLSEAADFCRRTGRYHQGSR